MTADRALGHFVTHRSLLFTVAYEVLGSAGDAEDVVQETWLRWAEVDLDQVREPRAYLVRIATRQALNRMRSLSRRKESYVGPWLPEPLLTSPDVAEDVELADSVSTAMLLVLETLGPTERAVFVLREVFAMEYEEIARAVDKSPAAVRQIAHRARSHVASRRPREVVSAEEGRRVIARFRAAVETGDLQSLVDVLAPDVVLVTDGGGVRNAARRPIVGVDKVLRFLVGTMEKTLRTEGEIAVSEAEVNGTPALLVTVAGVLDQSVTVRVEDGLVTGLYLVRNPDKLGHVVTPTPLAR